MARGKSWRLQEDVSLVRAIVRVLKDTSTFDRGAIAFWTRVTALYEQLLADEQAPPRTPGAVESRWKTLQAAMAAWVKCLAGAARSVGSDAPEAARIAAAMEFYRGQDPKKHAFDSLEVWECLRKEMPQYEEFVTSSTSFYMMQKKREGVLVDDDNGDENGEYEDATSTPSRKKKRASLSVYDAEAALIARSAATATPPREANGAPRPAINRVLPATEVSRELQRTPAPAPVPVVAPARSVATAAAPSSRTTAAEEAVDKAKHRKAMVDAAETRNTLLAEQNAIAAEKNMIALFASRDDAVSTEFFDLKRRIALAKLKRDFAAFLG
ncbi:hypothetical protein Gpo141_00002573 [Globisporangium polare]